MKKSEQISEFYIQRMEQQVNEINADILKEIGQRVRLIGTMNTTQAMQVVSMMEYGESYENIRNKLYRLTHKSYADIDRMFDEIAKENQYFAKQFYEYRGMPFIPFEQNEGLKSYVRGFANTAKNNYTKMMNSNVLGYGLMNADGSYQFMGIKDTMNYVVDKAVMAITQGKATFDQEMRSTLKQLGGSGLRVISGRTYIDKDGNVRNHSRRLDSTLRMYMLDSTRDFANNMQLKFGEEYGADGVEITVHDNPAPDHAPIQGKQFTLKEFVDIQAGEYGRAIGQYNCYHGILNIVMGVSKPQYTDEELQEIIDRNEKGFELDGKHYTLYQGTQIQRKIETAIRQQKDTQIVARASNNKELIAESQRKITKLNNQYKVLCEESGLIPKKNRASVSGYRRVKV